MYFPFLSLYSLDILVFCGCLMLSADLFIFLPFFVFFCRRQAMNKLSTSDSLHQSIWKCPHQVPSLRFDSEILILSILDRNEAYQWKEMQKWWIANVGYNFILNFVTFWCTLIALQIHIDTWLLSLLQCIIIHRMISFFVLLLPFWCSSNN